MAAKRPLTAPELDSIRKRSKQTAVPIPLVSQLALLNTANSPLLRLPAELRNRIYELVFGRQFYHVEAEYGWTSRRKPKGRPVPFNDTAWAQLKDSELSHLKSVYKDCRLRYFTCKARSSEDLASARSQDASLDERLPSDAVIMPNHWKLGDPFHIEPCKPRHEKCCASAGDYRPAWMLTRQEQAKLHREEPQHVGLYKALSLGLLQTSSQVYREAKHIAFAQNTFGFMDVYALLFFLTRLTLGQSQSLHSLWLYWRAGKDAARVSDSARWNNWLFAPGLLDKLQGLRVLHISLTIAHGGLGDRGPVRSDFLDGSINSWVIGLDRLRRLSLDKVTVIVSDEPESKFGKIGYTDRALEYGWNGNYVLWESLRERECLTAEQKRAWAEQLRKHLLKETPKNTLWL